MRILRNGMEVKLLRRSCIDGYQGAMRMVLGLSMRGNRIGQSAIYKQGNLVEVSWYDLDIDKFVKYELVFN